MQYYHKYDENQLLFDKFLRGLRIIVKTTLRILTYLPFFFTAYLLIAYLLPFKVQLPLTLVLLSFIAYILYQMIYFVKGAIIALKANNHVLWLPLFIISVAFTCILPVWLMYGPMLRLLGFTGISKWITWLALSSYALYIYSKFGFLSNRSPKSAHFFYQAGIATTKALLKRSQPF